MKIRLFLFWLFFSFNLFSQKEKLILNALDIKNLSDLSIKLPSDFDFMTGATNEYFELQKKQINELKKEEKKQFSFGEQFTLGVKLLELAYCDSVNYFFHAKHDLTYFKEANQIFNELKMNLVELDTSDIKHAVRIYEALAFSELENNHFDKTKLYLHEALKMDTSLYFKKEIWNNIQNIYLNRLNFVFTIYYEKLVKHDGTKIVTAPEILRKNIESYFDKIIQLNFMLLQEEFFKTKFLDEEINPNPSDEEFIEYLIGDLVCTYENPYYKSLNTYSLKKYGISAEELMVKRYHQFEK